MRGCPWLANVAEVLVVVVVLVKRAKLRAAVAAEGASVVARVRFRIKCGARAAPVASLEASEPSSLDASRANVAVAEDEDVVVVHVRVSTRIKSAAPSAGASLRVVVRASTARVSSVM